MKNINTIKVMIAIAIGVMCSSFINLFQNKVTSFIFIIAIAIIIGCFFNIIIKIYDELKKMNSEDKAI